MTSLDRLTEKMAQQPRSACEPSVQGPQAPNDLQDIEFPNPSFLLRALYRLRLHRFPLLFALLLEVRNLFWRIARLFRTQLYRKPLDIGPAFEKTPDGSFQESVRTRACSADMRSLYATYPAATILDAELFLGGWKRGWEWGHNHAGTGQRHR